MNHNVCLERGASLTARSGILDYILLCVQVYVWALLCDANWEAMRMLQGVRGVRERDE
jgi:hypothetical protein